MPADARADALRALGRFLVTRTTIGDTLLGIAEITVGAVPGAEVAGLTVLENDGSASTAVYTDATSPVVDEAQYTAGRGPGLDAWRTKQVVRVDDLDASPDYPEFSAVAREHGFCSTLSLPLIAGDVGIGALSLYSRRAHGFNESDEEISTDLAATAAVVLANVSAYWTAFALGEQLSQAMDSRAVIEQAKGMLMARDAQLTADEAFELLRRASQRENVKLREIATRIVERRSVAGLSDG